jgi:hypothetical protein
MISAIAGATARHRHAILLAGILLAAVEAALTAQTPMSGAAVFTPISVVLVLLLLDAAISRRARPTAFTMRSHPPAFTTPPRAGPVLTALAALAFSARAIGSALPSVRIDHLWSLDASTVGVYLIVLVLVVSRAWQGYDVYLRPEGLYDRRGFGTLFVPWDAGPVARLDRRRDPPPTTVVFPPGAFPARYAKDNRPEALRLDYRHPELVRRRGLVLRTKRLFTDHVDAQFLADVISFYAAHPGYRAGIGTEGGHQRLQQALAQRPQ